MKERKKRDGIIAALLTVMLMISLISIPVQQVQAVSPGTGGETTRSVEKTGAEQATYSVSLNLDGGTLTDLEEDGWVQSGDQWVRSLTEENPGAGVTLSVDTPERSGFLFGGWLVAETGETLQQLSDYSVSQDTTFTATWQEQTAPETTPDISNSSEEEKLENSENTDGTSVGNSTDGTDGTNDTDNAADDDTDETGDTSENQPLTTPSNSSLSGTDSDGTPSKDVQAYTVKLDLGGWTLPEDWNPEAGWTQQQDGMWSYAPEKNNSDAAVLSDGQNTVIFRLPTPTREGESFPGWTVLSPNDGTVSIQQDEQGDYLSLPAGNPCAVQLQVRSGNNDSGFAINFTSATYQAKMGLRSTNKVSFSHVNANYPEEPMTIDDILEFLNQYVPSLKLDYTITYTDETGAQKTVMRSGVNIPIEWTQEHADFRDVVDTQLAAMDGTSSKVRLNDGYLKALIVDYEKTVAQAEALPDAGSLTQEDFTFSNWDKGGDADKLALAIEIGASQNDDPNVSANKEKYTIDTVSPSNVKLNLFDYWLASDAYYDGNDKSMNVLAPLGINQRHGLLFFANGANGTWNVWTGTRAAPRAGIVKNELDENGYPVLNLSETFGANGSFGSAYDSYNPEESLKYLFDSEALNTSGDGKGYSDVKGLFKINEEGNYYFSSHDNFAEFDPASNSFNVYNTWGVYHNGSSPDGQFFPFNTAEQVFDLKDGKLKQASNLKSTDSLINHYLGLSMEAEFQQPINGMVSVGANAKPMVFEFSGDDDVWIFIDGVLVADLGGIHDEASVEIDFSTGKVITYLAADHSKNYVENTLKSIFAKAGKSTDTFNGDTFGNNTTHTLKMFYLERGNYDSNLTLSFNLMEPSSNTLIKLDQDGKPIKDVSFDLYVAQKNADGTYDTVGEPILTNIVTDADGSAVLENYDFSQHEYYILEETPPNGYFSPGKVVLRYDKFEKHPDGTTSGTNLLMVENRWTTGAVSNFSAAVYQAGTLKYDTEVEIDPEKGSKGLILAVPMLKGSDGEWYPLYGSNMVGFHDVEYEAGADKTNNQRRAVLKAALYQIYGAEYQKQDTNSYEYGFPEWYLEWNAENGRYEGNLIDLPGDASRYYWASNEADADLSMAYYFLDMDALSELLDLNPNNPDENLATMSSANKLKKIAQAIETTFTDDVTSEEVQSKVEKLVEKIDQPASDGNYTNFALLDISNFNRVFSSRIYVPNVSPELTVIKLDQTGDPLEGAEFTLYESVDNTESGTKTEVVSGTTNANGVLVFSASGTNTVGSAKVAFKKQHYYWVKETAVPANYTGNGTYIPVYVTENGRVYADALEKNDGITVRKGLGRLLETMVRYAAEDSVNVTLRDITAKLVTGKTWQEVGNAVQPGSGAVTGQELHLHYGLNNALLEYGTHAENGVAPNPYFEVDEDIAGIQVEQDYSAHEGDILYSTVANKINLENANIRSLFTGATAIVVRNRMQGTQGAFSVAKTVTGSDRDINKEFVFDVSIEGSQNWETGKASYTVTEQTQNGTQTLQTGTLTFTKTDDSWKITGVTPDASGDRTTYFQQDATKAYQLKLKDGQKILVNGVPFGLTVTVSETDDSSSGYITSYTINNGNVNSGTTASGVVKEEVGDPSFHFYNHKDKVANLTLKKLLPEEQENTRKFTFDITLRTSDGGSLITGTYSYTITDKQETVTKTGQVTNGQLTVELGHQDKLVIQGLPVGTRFIIRENTAGYAPTVEIGGTEATVVDGGTVTGTVKEIPTTSAAGSELNTVEYTNTRSGSLTITKRSGVGTLLSGAGFTLYTKEGDTLKPVGAEEFTALAVRCDISDPDNDPNFDRDRMRYTKDNQSYVVHTTKDNGYFYYRFLTEAEKQQYYNGSFNEKDKVEAIVQFTELPLDKTYAIKETTVPQGYVQNAAMEELLGDLKLPWKEEGDDSTDGVYDVLFTVTNHEQMVMPFTGLGGIQGPLVAGLLLIALAGMLLWVANRKTNVAGSKAKRHS